MLTFEEAARFLAYDPLTGLLRWKAGRSRTPAGAVAGSDNGKGHIQVTINRRAYLAHRLAWLLTHGAWPEKQIDHVNGARGDNRLDNLREATNAQNKQNVRRARRDNASTGALGVSKRKRDGRYAAQITVSGKTTFLGYFSTVEAASEAYWGAKRRLHAFAPAKGRG